MNSYIEILHPFEPIYNSESKLLILGSFPSVMSRNMNFYYSNPRNRFWKILPIIFDREVPLTVDEKKQFLLNLNIALWDVISRCEIIKSYDNSIKNVVPNDLMHIIKESNINNIVCNGRASYNLYKKYQYPITLIDPIYLPSTSPANASHQTEALAREWEIIRDLI